MNLDAHISAIESAVPNPTQGLPEPLFLMVSRLMPMVNVDLLIHNDRSETLLSWRDDAFYHGWHVPGGIVRVKERMSDRIAAVAASELGAKVEPTPAPIAINEIITERAVRAHFISFLFECAIVVGPDEAMRHVTGAPARGQWAWHARCPDDIIPVHKIYRRFIGSGR